MDVVNKEQARIAEEAGACAVMALGESLLISGRREEARMADPQVLSLSFPHTNTQLTHNVSQKVKEIQGAVTIPVMAKCRIGHFVEAQILESLTWTSLMNLKVS